MKDPAPVLRHACQWCGNRKHAIQYRAQVLLRPDGHTLVHAEKPAVSLVCPRCDSPGAVEE